LTFPEELPGAVSLASEEVVVMLTDKDVVEVDRVRSSLNWIVGNYDTRG